MVLQIELRAKKWTQTT